MNENEQTPANVIPDAVDQAQPDETQFQNEPEWDFDAGTDLPDAFEPEPDDKPVTEDEVASDDDGYDLSGFDVEVETAGLIDPSVYAALPDGPAKTRLMQHEQGFIKLKSDADLARQIDTAVTNAAQGDQDSRESLQKLANLAGARLVFDDEIENDEYNDENDYSAGPFSDVKNLKATVAKLENMVRNLTTGTEVSNWASTDNGKRAINKFSEVAGFSVPADMAFRARQFLDTNQALTATAIKKALLRADDTGGSRYIELSSNPAPVQKGSSPSSVRSSPSKSGPGTRHIKIGDPGWKDAFYGLK